VELDAFSCRLGFGQGRAPFDDPETSEEDFAFVLGDLAEGYLHTLELGDRAEVVQETDLTDVDFLRAEMNLRVPEDLPAGLAWEASIIADGVKMARAVCEPGREREITDLAANVSKLAGVRPVGVRLELVSV